MGIKKVTPLKAIRLKCLECCCGQANEVRNCHIKDCALWSYRMGHRPEEYPTYETPELSQEERYKAAERLRKIRTS